MEFEPVILKGFDGRKEALSRIKRYEEEFTPVMFYRTNDFAHSLRVMWHLEEAMPDILSVYGSHFNVGFARTLAQVHDDGEIITGDISLHTKEKMTEEELEQLAGKEQEAIAVLLSRYGRDANGYNYEELLMAAKAKNRLEAQFVSFFDKFDGAGEAWHEVWAGNTHFARPAGEYIRRLNDFQEKYPAMKIFFEKFPDYLPTPFDFTAVAKSGRPHSAESLRAGSGYLLYDRWKNTLTRREGIELLVRQIEFRQ